MLESCDDLLTADETAEVLKIGKNNLYKLLESGQLKVYRNGRVWRIPRLSVEQYILTQAKLT